MATSGYCILINRAAVTPSIFCILTSIRTMAGLSRPTLSTASSPSLASPTTSILGYGLRMLLTTCLNMAWSSTISIRIFLPIVIETYVKDFPVHQNTTQQIRLCRGTVATTPRCDSVHFLTTQHASRVQRQFPTAWTQRIHCWWKCNLHGNFLH